MKQNYSTNLPLLTVACSALIATMTAVYRLLNMWPQIVGSPHVVRCDAADAPHSPTDAEPVEFSTHMDSFEWADAVIEELRRKIESDTGRKE